MNTNLLPRLLGALLMVGAATGALATDVSTLLGGGLGAAAGAAIGQSVGGKNGAILGAAVGGAAGATLGKGATQQVQASGGMRTGGGDYYDDHRGGKGHNKHGKKDRCFEEHPGKGHANGKYKDCY